MTTSIDDAKSIQENQSIFTPAVPDREPVSGSRGAFTRYLRALARSPEVGEEVFDEMWRALRSALVYELRRGGLWTSSPNFLGIYGWPSWHQRASAPGRTGSALAELLVDCYSSIFIKRLPRLKAQLAVKPTIDGLVFLFLRNYIHERRKAHDPLGFKVYKTLAAAVREAIDAGELTCLGGEGKIRNPSLLAFRAGEDPRRAARTAAIEPIVRQWCDELLPDLVTAVGAQRRALITELRRKLPGLAAVGVAVFRFRDLVDPLKRGVRARWAALLELADDAASQPPATDDFDRLTRRVAERLELLDASPRTRRYLARLWGFLRLYAVDSRCEQLPSNRQLAALLRIPRERFPGLFATLRRVVGQDQAPAPAPTPTPAPCDRARRGWRRPASAFGAVGLASPVFPPAAAPPPAALGASP